MKIFLLACLIVGLIALFLLTKKGRGFLVMLCGFVILMIGLVFLIAG